jgi:MerR family redox-sensitive transcriptional activator SoxR
MSWLRISEVARQMRLRPSAIRYYEQLGILPKPERISGKRRYDRTVLYRLAVIQQAREAGFALQEIRTLFFGFQEGTRAEARWRRLAHRKLAELDQLARHIRRMSTLLKRLNANCHCKTLEACGKAILENRVSRVEGPSFRVISKPCE